MAARTLALLAGTVLLVSSCTAPSDISVEQRAADSGSTTSDPASDDHGAIAGAQEVAEPPLHLVTVDPAGKVGMLDLLSEEATDLGSISKPSSVATDGRYVFASVPGGVEVIDSGMWSWDHGDHFHYYRSDADLLGTVAGQGEVTVSPGPLSTGGGTGIFFDGTGDAVLLDNAALSDGEIVETFRVVQPPHDGLIAPLGDGAVVSVADAAGAATAVQLLDASGDPVDGRRVGCRDARGSITTTVGLVIGCADGALLWTSDDDETTVERIRYPERTDAPAAAAFTARKGRPTVAALAGRTGFWLLDTRERTWQHHDVEVPLAQVSSSDDEGGHVVALDRSGRVHVYAAETGEQLAVTRPLLGSPSGVERTIGQVQLYVDQQRAYLNAPAQGVVYEIDYADSARIARTLRTPVSPAFLAETGR